MMNYGVIVATSITPSIVTYARQVIATAMITLVSAMILSARIATPIVATTAMIATRTTTMTRLASVEKR